MNFVEIQSREELKEKKINNFDTPFITKVKIDKITPKEVVEAVVKYEKFGDVWVYTNNSQFVGLNKIANKEGWIIFKNTNKPQEAKLQRILDLILSTLLLICVTPLILFPFVVIKLITKENILFSQKRIKEGWKEFNLYKIRTMRDGENNEEIHLGYMKEVINGNTKGNKVHKLIDDPRVTTFGKLLRRLSIDEIPQFINVIKGDMSIVGPRPPIPYEVKLYKDWQLNRLRTKPGITGLWQIMGRSCIPFDEMVVIDLYYAKNKSIWLYFKIMFLTIPAILSLRGAY